MRRTSVKSSRTVRALAARWRPQPSSASSVLIAAPANAAGDGDLHGSRGCQTDFVAVPANVHSITYTVAAVAEVATAMAFTAVPADGARRVDGQPSRSPRATRLTLWVAGAGQDGLANAGLAPGDGGIGFVEGGDGGWGGTFVIPNVISLSASRPGAGGGGSSAILLNSNLVVSAAGGGGGGGRGMDDIVSRSPCIGGDGGDAGQAGGSSAGGDNAPYDKCPVATGGSAGVAAQSPGGDATDVPQQNIVYVAVGGAGGGGAGDGGAGNTNLNPNEIAIPAAGGGGGAGGASFLNAALSPDAVVAVAEPTTEVGDGWITLEWVVTLPATGPVNVPLFAGGALLLLVLGGTLFVIRRRADAV